MKCQNYMTKILLTNLEKEFNMNEDKSKHGGRALKIAQEKKITMNKILDFSSNINPFGMDKSLIKVIKDNIKFLRYYPQLDLNQLKIKISNLFQTNPENIRLGSGATDIIYRLANIFYIQESKKKILFINPSFLEYKLSFKAYEDIEIINYMLDVNNFNIKEDILKYLDKDLLALYICNPNNPSSNLMDANLLNIILNVCKKNNIYLIMDECFMDFVENERKYSLISKIDEFDNLIILRTFTKLFAMPAIRLAYLLSSNQRILKSFDNLSPTWNISTIPLNVGLRAIDIYKKIRNKNLKYLKKERKYLKNKLEELDIEVYHSDTNFILFKLEMQKKSLEKYLLGYNVLIRSCRDFKGLDESYYRICIRTHRENKRIIKLMREYLR